MKNILKIFIDDVKRIRKNVIAMIVVIGVLVVPCLYAQIIFKNSSKGNISL